MEGKYFDLSSCEFRYAMVLHYGCIPEDLPTHCDADEGILTVNYALNCLKGGLVYHNGWHL